MLIMLYISIYFLKYVCFVIVSLDAAFYKYELDLACWPRIQCAHRYLIHMARYLEYVIHI